MSTSPNTSTVRDLNSACATGEMGCSGVLSSGFSFSLSSSSSSNWRKAWLLMMRGIPLDLVCFEASAKGDDGIGPAGGTSSRGNRGGGTPANSTWEGVMAAEGQRNSGKFGALS